MGGGLPRKWAQSLSSAPALASFKKKAAEAVAEAAQRVGVLAGEAARGAAHSAKQLAVQGAYRTGKAMARGGDTLRRHAAAYVKANADAAAQGLRTRGGVAVAQMQTAVSEYSVKFMQAATDFAVRIISRHQQANEQAKLNNAVEPSSIVAKTVTKKTPEDTECASKGP